MKSALGADLQTMKTKIASYLKRLNSVGVESSLFIFRCCFGFLSLSFEELSAEQVEIWIKQLQNNSAKSPYGIISLTSGY